MALCIKFLVIRGVFWKGSEGSQGSNSTLEALFGMCKAPSSAPSAIFKKILRIACSSFSSYSFFQEPVPFNAEQNLTQKNCIVKPAIILIRLGQGSSCVFQAGGSSSEFPASVSCWIPYRGLVVCWNWSPVRMLSQLLWVFSTLNMETAKGSGESCAESTYSSWNLASS